MAYCLNPDPQYRHENRADDYYRCRVCNFLVEGALLDGYKVLSFLGGGSFGDVYKVRESPPLGRILALKILNFQKSGTKANASIARDAKIIAKLRHPHILPVYHFGTLKDSRPYFSMELATTTLGNMFPMRKDGKRKLADAEELVPFIEQAAKALTFLHENKFVHQDIKPENLLIIDKQSEKQLFLSDFGIACFLGQATQANTSHVAGLGTPQYKAPEQWDGDPVPATDQYALAVSIYELLAGRRPFDQPFDHLNPSQLRFAQSQYPPPSPRQWNPRIPLEVESVLLRALAKDHHVRYRTINDFAESYSQAVYATLERYACQNCGNQNRSGSRFCSHCRSNQDHRRCPFCDTPAPLGERICQACKRLIFPPHIARNSQLQEVSFRQGRYVIQHVLKKADSIPSPVAHYATGPRPEDSKVMVAIASDTRNGDKQVILKRWTCSEYPLDRRRGDILHYDQATSDLKKSLQHPLIPHVLDRFAEGKYYYMVQEYIQGESLAERLHRLQGPLPEHDVIVYMFHLLNILIALEGQNPPLYHFDISPANIIIDTSRPGERAFLTGFQIPPPPSRPGMPLHTTRNIPKSPYLPLLPANAAYDRRTCIYMLAATMHHALTNYAPEVYPATQPPLPVRLFSPWVTPTLTAILYCALQENPAQRYQSYQQMQREVKKLL